MITQTIEVEGLPEGWKAVSYRVPVNGENFFYDGKICNDKNQRHEYLIVEKIQPRRVVLEETREENSKIGFSYKKQTFLDGTICLVSQKNIFKLIKETDIPLTKEEPYLKLSVAECKSIYKWMDDVGINFNKITEFIKDK